MRTESETVGPTTGSNDQAMETETAGLATTAGSSNRFTEN